MAKKGGVQQLQTEINTTEELTKFIERDGLISKYTIACAEWASIPPITYVAINSSRCLYRMVWSVSGNGRQPKESKIGTGWR